MKLWDRKSFTEEKILAFTTGMDPVYDMELSPYDVIGSMAHAIMLGESGLLTRQEASTLVEELSGLLSLAQEGELKLREGVEDIHSQVELMLTQQLGDLGKKIHTGRSRNDQVMLDIKLFLRDQIREIFLLAGDLGTELTEKASRYRETGMPGYTHMQVAMPSSFGLWFGAFAEALADDMEYLKGIYRLVNQNPLGSAAGFGSSFPVDRQLTTRLLGFEGLHISSVNAQLNRGKAEWYTATGIAAIAATLSKLAMDMVLYMGQNFRFLKLPDEMTTGSSVMPHKKNPDVLELIRARCNRLTGLPAEISAVTGNLTSGYHRDFQILKESIHPALGSIRSCLDMMSYTVGQVEVNPAILEEGIYEYIWSVEDVNEKVKSGIPFRDAYREIADEIDKGRYRRGREHTYTHLGSIGNPGLNEIRAKLERASDGFRFADTGEIASALSNYFKKSHDT